jgi:hypothetical protein
MDKKAEEVMPGEDIGSGPAREQRKEGFYIKHKNKSFLREEAYLKHKDEFIVHNLYIIFNLEHLEENLKSISELVYFF